MKKVARMGMALLGLSLLPAMSLAESPVQNPREERDRAVAENALIAQAQAALAGKQWQAAAEAFQKLAAANPKWEFFSGLGSAELNLGHYPEALSAYDKGVALARQSPPEVKTRQGLAAMLINQGNAYLKLHKSEEAIAAYVAAAEIDPHPATAYFNLCAIQYNSGNFKGALAACDKAIAADPKKADAYFIKGSILLGDAKSAGDKFVAPDGTKEALGKYLELAPDGGHAADVRQMLEVLK